jgi:NADH:ubiquinone oxidoreductase subunit K
VVAAYFGFAGLFFFIGLYCLLTTRNMIRSLIGVELMGKSVVIALGAAGYVRGDTFFSQSLLITFIVVEVSVIAVALALVIRAYHTTGGLDIHDLTRLRG